VARNRTKKIIRAGDLVIETIYPRAERSDSDRVRAAKRKASSEAQKRMNQIYSWQKLELMLAANFRRGDLWITLTYDDAHLPQSRAQAQSCVKYFLQKLNAERKKAGLPPVVAVWNCEKKHRDDDYYQNERWHHHLCLRATGSDFDMIRRCWIYGDNLEFRDLKLSPEFTYERVARYMCKEAPELKVGQHCWSYTRSTCQKPEIETVRVDSDEQLRIPRGSLRLEQDSRENQFSKWAYIKYLAPGWDGTGKVRAKRRRRAF